MGVSGLEELLGLPPEVTCCTYTTSDTSKGLALMASVLMAHLCIRVGRGRARAESKRSLMNSPSLGETVCGVSQA